MDFRAATVIGVAYWIGAGFQGGLIFSDSLGEFWGALLGNGMTAGGAAILLLMLFLHATGPKTFRLETTLDTGAMPKLDDFLVSWAEGRRWDERSRERLRSTGEEALLVLGGEDEASSGPSRGTGIPTAGLLVLGGEDKASDRKLRVSARGDARSVEVEFVAAPSEGNIEDRLFALGDPAGASMERDLSLRLLRHHAAAVRHRNYHEVDIVSVTVERRT